MPWNRGTQRLEHSNLRGKKEATRVHTGLIPREVMGSGPRDRNGGRGDLLHRRGGTGVLEENVFKKESTLHVQKGQERVYLRGGASISILRERVRVVKHSDSRGKLNKEITGDWGPKNFSEYRSERGRSLKRNQKDGRRTSALAREKVLQVVIHIPRGPT